MADERLRSLEREGNSAHATCRAVGHAWVPVILENGERQDPRGYFHAKPFRRVDLVARARQMGSTLNPMLLVDRVLLGEDPMEWALLSRQRPRLCTRCNSLDQRWGPWRLECGPTWPRSLVVSDHAGERVIALDPAEVERDMQEFRAYVANMFARHVHDEAPTGEPPGPNSLAGEG